MRERKEVLVGSQVVESWENVRESIKRLGPIRGAVIDALDVAGGTLTLQELAATLHKSRPRDLRRRTLPMLEKTGIITVAGELVSLTEDWFGALEREREIAGEIEAERLQRQRFKRESDAFRNRRKVKLDRHFANAGADGYVEDLHPADAEPKGPPPESPEPEISSLAVAIRDYLDGNPHDACQPPGWIGSTLWAYDLCPGKPTPAEIRAAIDELGGEAFLRDHLERARRAA